MLKSVRLLLLSLGAVIAFGGSAPASGSRPWPDTRSGVHVFNDQLAPSLSDRLIRFAATNYDGAQKMIRSETDRLRAVDPDFLILHYRLGEGLGYRAIEGGCEPSGAWLEIIEGDTWVREWPDPVDPAWFYSYGGSPRVLNCDWGWYLTDLDSPAWRAWWQSEVLRQIEAGDDDGVFIDSLSVPNYLGGGSFSPALPDVDPAFERDWSRKIGEWLAWLQTQPIGERYKVVPNVGSWLTTRDVTDYSSADGVMVEGFAIEADATPYPLEDWKLQANRVLDLTAIGRAVIGQTYVYGARERMFALGTYLLVKHKRSYINLEQGYEPEWWPEYEVRIGRPGSAPPARIAKLRLEGLEIYARRFSNGRVLVNPTSPWDGSATTETVRLGHPMWRAVPHGGGTVPRSGRKPGRLSYERVRRVELRPYSAAVLLRRRPG